MTDNATLLLGAKHIVQRCLGLQQGQELVVFVDETTLDVGMQIMEAADQLAVSSTGLLIPISQQRRIRAKSDLSLSVQGALREVQAILTCVNARPDCLSFRELVLETNWSARTRIGHMPGATRDILNLANVDFETLSAACQGIGLAMVRGHTLELHSHTCQGHRHRLFIDIAGWDHLPVASDGIIADGVWGNVPSGETFIVPVEGKSRGAVVINGSIPGHVVEPGEEILLHFEAGKLIQIDPPDNQTAQWLEQTQLQRAKIQGDLNWANLAEFGIGVNPAVPHLTGKMLIDEKAAGTAHIALGSSTYLGGSVRSDIHCTLVTQLPTVFIDGKAIVNQGTLCFKETDWRESFKAVSLQTSPLHTAQEAARSGIEFNGSGGRLQRILRSETGRLLHCFVGDDETARLAHNLYSHLPGGDHAVPIAKLAEQAHLPQETTRRVLHLMWDYGMVIIQGQTK